MENYINSLELHKILEMLSIEASNNKTKEMATSLKPISVFEKVVSEVEKTSYAFSLSSRYGTPSFYNFKDITSSVQRAEAGAKLSLKELIDIKQMLYQMRQLNFWYNQIDESYLEDGHIDYLFSQIFSNKYLEDKIANTIIDEETIADTASAELGSIRRKIIQAGLKIRESLDKMIKSTANQKFLQDSIVTLRDGRYCLPVKSEYKSEVQGLVHDTSSSGQTFFVEPIAVVEANNEIRVLKGAEQDEIERIIAELSALCADFGDNIKNGFNISAELNLYFAKANLAAKMKSSQPEIVNNGELILKKARHPLIDKNVVVPVDISLGIDYDALIITGPNTGGKTVILKTVGLLTAMTMCGLLIPVSDGSKISVFENILVDIGDQQSIEQSLSTFSSHMNRVIQILEEANHSSLVLLDELGSGTDPVEGAALAVSIIEKLKCKGAKLVTTTHYQELKLYALESENVENASCEFDVKTLMPTYRLIIGSPGRSNAFEISRKLGLSDDIIENAMSLVGSENSRFETVIERLEASRIELEDSSRKAEQYKHEYELLKNEIAAEHEKLQSQKDNELEKSRRDAMRIIESVRFQSDKILDELDDLRKQKNKEDFAKRSADARSQMKNQLDKLYLEANPVISRKINYQLPRPLKKGDSVVIIDSNTNATVISEPDSNGNVMIQSGIIKTKIKSVQLKLVEGEKVTYNSKKISTSGIESRKTRIVKNELDLRGYASDEGIMETDRFLDDAVMGGITLVTIIHGKGTGVLRNSIRAHLKSHPLVKSYRRGVYGEGEDGVTMVELK